ncbi:MAG: hypothetical protein CML47_10435 [Rhodobacteraceae bacterium]|nr:MAG: hypothetical protein CML47_10435 [Paracoccaceae bacterium]
MDRITNFLKLDETDNSVAIEILSGIVICFVIWIVWIIIKMAITKVSNTSNDAPVIFSGYVDAQKPRIAVQDPNYEGSITLPRSLNENGLEYSYSVWMWIDGSTWDGSKKWRHVFHKGPTLSSTTKNVLPHESNEIMCPGLWLSPIDNTLRLYVNTFNSVREYVDISNLPIKKWINLIYTQSNFTSNVYINGRLKTTHTLQSLPRQNYYDLHITQKGGFKGYLSKMQYYNYVIDPGTIYDIANRGPNLVKQQDKQTKKDSDEAYLTSNLPYLSNRWWVDDLTLN